MINFFLLISLTAADFPICTAESFQDHPVVRYVDSIYYVFWKDDRFYPSVNRYAVYGARVSLEGNVLDPDGRLIFCDSVESRVDGDFGMSHFLLVCRNGC
jgi:hypothetical protein